MQSHGRPPWRAWKHYHHHHMWLELLPRGALVLHDRAPLSNGRPTRSLIVPSPVATVAAQDKAGQKWDQLHGWALNERQKLYCGLLYIRYRSNTVDILSFRGQRVQFVLMAVNSVTLQAHGCKRLPAAWLRKSWRLDKTTFLYGLSNVKIYVKSGEQSFLASQHWYAHLFQDCNLLQTF